MELESEDVDEPVEFEIMDWLDLHTFRPGEVRELVDDYLNLAHEKGYKEIRIIHGKGIGVQRNIVESVLRRSPHVRGFHQAPQERGGWGATIVELK
jgi:dsDNA-specific endonuclease/ATPase MutS2